MFILFPNHSIANYRFDKAILIVKEEIIKLTILFSGRLLQHVFKCLVYDEMMITQKRCVLLYSGTVMTEKLLLCNCFSISYWVTSAGKIPKQMILLLMFSIQNFQAQNLVILRSANE